MDPTACFARFVEAIHDGDGETAADAADDYNGWLHRGGFPATDEDGNAIVRLDAEADSYLIGEPGPERWVRL